MPIRKVKTCCAARCGGIALVELVTALFVLMVGLLGALQMYHFCLDKTRAVKELNTATTALQNEMEFIRALPLTALANGEHLSFRSETPGLADLVNVEATVKVEDYPDGPRGLKRIALRVRWTGENGRTIEKGLVTLIAGKVGAALGAENLEARGTGTNVSVSAGKAHAAL